MSIGQEATEAVFQHGAADVFVQLSWKHNNDTNKAEYEILIVDTGYNDWCRRNSDGMREPGARQEFSSTITPRYAAALMFIAVNADEDDRDLPVTEDALVSVMYTIAEEWIAMVALPRNLRFIP